MKNTAKYQMVLTVVGALNHPIRLCMLDELQNGPKTVDQLASICECSLQEAKEHLALLKQAGLLLGEWDTAEPIALSPFGVYGAGKLLDEVLVVTHEDGSCGGCKGCSEKK